MLQQIKAMGFECWGYSGSKTWCYVVAPEGVAYVQWGDGQRVCTVHKPSKQVGTGFAMAEVITRETIMQALTTIAPHWASANDRAAVRKWRDWAALQAGSAWHGAMVRL